MLPGAFFIYLKERERDNSALQREAGGAEQFSRQQLVPAARRGAEKAKTGPAMLSNSQII